MRCPSFDSGGIGGELPPCYAFIEKTLEESCEDDRPQESQPVVGSPDCGRNDIAGADAGRGHKQAGPDHLRDAEPLDLLLRFQTPSTSCACELRRPWYPSAHPRTAADRSKDRYHDSDMDKRQPA